MDSLTTPIHIDLYDFEDPKYEDSKYVLTSPRSLEACARVGVKPMELLYKPLADFQEEHLAEGTSLQTIYNMYDEQENERIRVLKLCRHERDHLVSEDEVKSISRLSPIAGSYIRPTSPGSEMRSRSPATNKMSFASKSATLLLDDKLRNLERKTEADNSRDSPVDKGSLQRIRTAWATSGGDGDKHETGEEKDIEDKEKHLFEKSEKGAGKSILRQRASSLERPRRLASHSSRESSIRSRTNSERSFPLDNTWASVLKNSISSAKPILDSKLRNRLRGCNVAGVRIPERDQKILSCLMAKEEDEKERARMRESALNVWEEERKKELRQRQREEADRRRALLTKSGERQKKLSANESKRKEAEEADLKQREQKIEMSDKHWQEQAAKLERDRRQKLIEKKQQEMQRRRSVERNLQAKEKENEEFGKMVIQYQDNAIKKALTAKEAQLHEEKMRRRLQNQREMRDFKSRHQQVEKMTEEEIEAMRASIEYKHKKAEENYENINVKKYHEIEAHHREREKQDRLLKQNLEKMEKEMEDYKKNLRVYRQVKEQQADEIVNTVTLKKKLRAQEERAQREALQRANYRKERKKEAARLHDMKETIAWKDAKAQVIQEEKEQTVSQLRALAHTSELLRGELMQRYNKDSFDQKVKKVELETKIGVGNRNSLRNSSSVKLY
ncbi:coiled-coil domain-containing protein 177-like [Lineus longissimus]|uniref:coiled-coil domain-containing protein 177-like n=1 Tax=Lineus longissimus TaxID=88925 RepID=UPI002B4EB58C